MKLKKRKCATKHCRNKVTISEYCTTCRCRKSREKNPIKYCYYNLKHNAKRRKKIFTITFEEFVQFCYRTDYLQGKGKKRDSYSIDCIDPTKGYTLDNIQILPLWVNSSKGNKVLNYDWQTKYATVVHNKPEPMKNTYDYF